MLVEENAVGYLGGDKGGCFRPSEWKKGGGEREEDSFDWLNGGKEKDGKPGYRQSEGYIERTKDSLGWTVLEREKMV